MPSAGATQPVGGFSALLDAGDGDFWAMPDNGFGNKANSRSFILRLYKVKPNWRTEWSGKGTVNVKSAITLSDPDEKIPFPIVNENTEERILTGGDFDVESVRQAPDGTFFFGEEFGPFIVHVDATGKVLDAPIGIPKIAGQKPVARPTTRTSSVARTTSAALRASRRWRSRTMARRCTRSSRAP